jgi:hypothetical protein
MPTVAAVDVSGEYRYLDSGIAIVGQDGNDVHMLLTWTPQGAGPHYEVKGKISGNLIEGEWYSHVAQKGWYHFKAEVSTSGKTINFSKTEDPLGVYMNQITLSR